MQTFKVPLGHTIHLEATAYGGHQSGSPVVILQPATAVPERLYIPFATYLAERGFTVITYNYRGVGKEALAHRHLRMRDWADTEVNAVIIAVRNRYSGSPLLAIGHSFGGHAVGLSEQSRHLTAAVLIASNAGYLGFITPLFERLKATFFLHALGRTLGATLGYFPGKRLGLGEDLSAGVLDEWRRWTKLPHYFFDDPSLDAKARFAAIRCPILCYGFTDDPWATEPAITELVRHFRNAHVTRRQFDPAVVGSGSIGHLGFFRERHIEHLWPGVANWLLQQCESDATRHRSP